MAGVLPKVDENEEEYNSEDEEDENDGRYHSRQNNMKKYMDQYGEDNE